MEKTLSREEELTQRLQQLIFVLQDEAEENDDEVEDPPEEAASSWTEAQIREYYASKGEKRPAAGANGGGGGASNGNGATSGPGVAPAPAAERDACPSQPGGGVDLSALGHDASAWTQAPEHTQNWFFDNDCEAYRKVAFAAGIPFRPHGLFPANDAILAELSADATCTPFQKHLRGPSGPNDLVLSSWAVGDGAAAHGLDLRYFYRRRAAGEKWATLVGAVRLGDRASIGSGHWTASHGGAVETVLDESTAELAKSELFPTATTSEATFKMKKPAPLHQTLRIKCWVESVQGLKAVVCGKILNNNDELVAECKASLVDVARLQQAMGMRK